MVKETQLRINEINALEIKEFQNPWSFHSLFISGDDIVCNWLRKNGLLASDLTCHCGKEAKRNKRNHLKMAILSGVDHSMNLQCAKILSLRNPHII